MNLQCDVKLAASYKGGSQIARILTEEWCSREMYCPACTNDDLHRSRANTPAVDFVCEECDQRFQLKAQRQWNTSRIVDGAYRTMLEAVRSDKNPSLFVLQYSSSWMVQNLQVIPWTFFSADLVQPRPPLSENARRAGWVGCNILLGQVPIDGKIPVVTSGLPVPPELVRERFFRAQNLSRLGESLRGWALDVLRIVRKMNKGIFDLGDAYAFEDELKEKYPSNKNIRPKIRQQLQLLRDAGYIQFLGHGRYRIYDSNPEVLRAKAGSF